MERIIQLRFSQSPNPLYSTSNRKATPSLLHKSLKKELLSDGREYSWLYTWEGKNKDLPPIVLTAHQDVVPVALGTEQNGEYDAYSGPIEIEIPLASGFQPEHYLPIIYSTLRRRWHRG
jgi:hypothetical protein